MYSSICVLVEHAKLCAISLTLKLCTGVPIPIHFARLDAFYIYIHRPRTKDPSFSSRTPIWRKFACTIHLYTRYIDGESPPCVNTAPHTSDDRVNSTRRASMLFDAQQRDPTRRAAK